MGTFDDANVDKDLLSQIFADEGDDAETDALLDEMLKEVEVEETKDVSDTDDVLDATESSDDVSEETEEEKAEEAAPEAEEEKNEPEVPLAKPVFETNSENDSVRKEAKEQMDAERQSGTVTTITSGTTIKGGISSDGSLEVMGVITGDVECQGKVSIIGKVSGNVIASDRKSVV